MMKKILIAAVFLILPAVAWAQASDCVFASLPDLGISSGVPLAGSPASISFLVNPANAPTATPEDFLDVATRAAGVWTTEGGRRSPSRSVGRPMPIRWLNSMGQTVPMRSMRRVGMG